MAQSRRRPGAVQRYLEQRAPARRHQATASASQPPIYGLPAQESLSPAPSAESAVVPDLLHPEPSARIDFRAGARALEFAFAAGDSAGIASSALSTAALADSLWQPAAFESELFVDELIDGVLTFEVEGRRATLDSGYLKRLLTRPPRDLATVLLRQEVLRELAQSEELRRALGAVHARIAEILRLLDESGAENRYGMPRWRLDLLLAVRAFFDDLRGPFAGASSVLSRLHSYAEHVHESEGYRELCALLDFEGDRARVDLRIRIGADGSVRELHTLAVRESNAPPYVSGLLARWKLRLLSLWRGYQLSDVGVVERWFEHVFSGVLPFLPAALQLRGDLEFYLAGCQFSELAKQRQLSVCIPELCTDEMPGQPCVEKKCVRGLFNPLLLRMVQTPVPCDLELDTFRRSCVLTGPNSGGKTRLLQALALTQMLGQAGLYVPAAKAVLRPASGMFVSLGQPSSADAGEGRLGVELLRIRRLFESARPRCLIVLDELCSGTNPSEGEEIFHLVVDLLRELGPEVYVTTHFLQFAASLEARAEELGLCFLQVELDELRVPTYQFVAGVATTSLAQQTAARLGVSRDELLALIRRNS